MSRYIDNDNNATMLIKGEIVHKHYMPSKFLPEDDADFILSILKDPDVTISGSYPALVDNGKANLASDIDIFCATEAAIGKVIGKVCTYGLIEFKRITYLNCTVNIECIRKRNNEPIVYQLILVNWYDKKVPFPEFVIRRFDFDHVKLALHCKANDRVTIYKTNRYVQTWRDRMVTLDTSRHYTANRIMKIFKYGLRISDGSSLRGNRSHRRTRMFLPQIIAESLKDEFGRIDANKIYGGLEVQTHEIRPIYGIGSKDGHGCVARRYFPLQFDFKLDVIIKEYMMRYENYVGLVIDRFEALQCVLADLHYMGAPCIRYTHLSDLIHYNGDCDGLEKRQQFASRNPEKKRYDIDQLNKLSGEHQRLILDKLYRICHALTWVIYPGNSSQWDEQYPYSLYDRVSALTKAAFVYMNRELKNYSCKDFDEYATELLATEIDINTI